MSTSSTSTSATWRKKYDNEVFTTVGPKKTKATVEPKKTEQLKPMSFQSTNPSMAALLIQFLSELHGEAFIGDWNIREVCEKLDGDIWKIKSKNPQKKVESDKVKLYCLAFPMWVIDFILRKKYDECQRGSQEESALLRKIFGRHHRIRDGSDLAKILADVKARWDQKFEDFRKFNLPILVQDAWSEVYKYCRRTILSSKYFTSNRDLACKESYSDMMDRLTAADSEDKKRAEWVSVHITFAHIKLYDEIMKSMTTK